MLRKERNRAINRETYREACNKLIHAKHFSFGMTSLPGKMRFLSGSVELHGMKGKQTWAAQVDLSAFIRMAVRQL